MASSVASRIWSFLAGKGLSPAQIAGIMGNLQVESGFDSTEPNSSEGAIGIAQWEGGRRTALQQFAAQHGSTETDLNMQLNFMWAELNGSESGALARLKQTQTAGDAAAAWDQYYERSSGDARSSRVADAQTIFTAFSSGGVAALDKLSYGGGGASTNSAGQTALTPKGLSAQDYQDALGNLAGLLTTVPELVNLVKQAQDGGWTQGAFLDKVYQSKWWQTHNDSARQLIGLSLADKAEYSTRLQNAQSQVQNLANSMGVKLSGAQLKNLSYQFLVQGWDQQTLANTVGKDFNVHTKAGDLQGLSAQYYQQLKQTYAEYGVPISDLSLRMRVSSLLAGSTDMNTFKQAAISSAKSMFPSLSGQLDAGLTVSQIADPYVQTMANILEVDPNEVGVTDPLVQKALQGTTTTGNDGKTSATSTPLWQFQQQLRSDPRWGKTQNARDTISSALVHVGRDFGFGGF